MGAGDLGRVYQDGEVIVRQGEAGDCMYVIQAGKAEVLQEQDGRNMHRAVLEEKDFFGEMALFERKVRSATVRALAEVRILTVDKRAFLRRIQEDPTLAVRVVGQLCHRVRRLDEELARIKAGT